MRRRLKKDVLSEIFVVMFGVFSMAAGIFLGVDCAAAEAPEWTISPASQIGGWPGNLNIHGDYAYFAEGSSIRVFNVSGDQPQLAGSLVLPDEPSQIFVAGRYAYVCISWPDRWFGVVDLADPANPSIAGSYVPEGSLNDLFVLGNYAYILTSQNLLIINVSAPDNPQLEKRIDTIQGSKFSISGDKMVVVDGTKVSIYNFTDPLDPVKFSPGEYSPVFSNLREVYIEGSYAYLASDTDGMEIIDFSTPETPVKTDTFAPDGMGSGGVVAKNGLAYIAAMDKGMIIADVSDPGNISEKGRLDGIWANDISVSYPYAYVLSSKQNTLIKINISSPQSPSLTGAYKSPPGAESLCFDDQKLYMGGWSSLWVYDMTDTNNPALLSSYNQWPNLRELSVIGNTLYALKGGWQDTDYRLIIFDASNPQRISETGSYSADQEIRKLFVDGNLAYLIFKDSSIKIIDVSTPNNPVNSNRTIVGDMTFSDISDIYVGNGLAFLAGTSQDDQLVKIFNVQNSPGTLLSTIAVTGDGPSLSVIKDTLFVTSSFHDYSQNPYVAKGFLQAFDISNPSSPTAKGNFTMDDMAFTDIDVQGLGIYRETTGGGRHTLGGAASGVAIFGAAGTMSGGGVQTWFYDPSTGEFTEGGLCTSPGPDQVTTTPSASGSSDYIVVTRDCSMGTYTQEYKITSGKCCLKTKVSPAEAATDGCTATPADSGEVECDTQVQVQATEEGPWNFKEWTGAASGSNATTTGTADGHCATAVANFVKPVLTLGAGPQNPQPNTRVYSVKTEVGYKLTDESFTRLAAAGVPAEIIAKLPKDHEYTSDEDFLAAILAQLGADDTALYKDKIFEHAMSLWAENVMIADITLTANLADSWTVTAVGFKASGSGNELPDEDVVEARLYLNGIGGKLLGKTVYSADDGEISFSMSEQIAPGESIRMILVYDFNGEKACPCDTFAAKTHMGMISAKPDTYPNYLKLPVPDAGVTGGPTRIKQGTLTIVQGDEQYGTPNKPDDDPKEKLPEPFKVRVGWQDPKCVKYIAFEMQSPGGAFLLNGSTSSHVQVDGYNIATEHLTLGEKKGKKHPYFTKATLSNNGAQCGYYDGYVQSVLFRSYGLGVDLSVAAQHDGTGGDDDTIATFISAIQADNKLTVNIDMAPEDYAQVDMVTFNLGGVIQQGTEVTANKVYETTYDMKQFDQPKKLVVTATMTKDGNIMEEKAEYTVKALKLPSWVSAVNAICHEESYSQEFDPEAEKYKFEFSYPTNFAWSDYVPGSVGLLGGLDNDLDIEFNASAWYGINEISNFGATVKGRPKILGQEFDIEGNLAGTFDSDFAFQRGNGALKADTSFDLPEKGYSKTFVVYGVPITVAVDLGGHVEIFVNGSAVLNKHLEFGKITVAPSTTVTGNITISLAAALGLAKIAATGSPSATVEIEVTYVTRSGTTTTWKGEVVVPLKVVGSIFWGMGSAELWTGELGPWTFGSGGGRSTAAFRSPKAAEGPASPRFISTSAMAMDTSGKRIVVWIGDTATAPDPPNPDVYYRYYNGTIWTGAGPIIAQSPNQEWETDPAMVFMSNGTALAAWTANDGAHTLNNLNDILAAQDIAYSVWNGASWSAPARIIDDAEADGTVQLAYDLANNKIMAVWIHDANTDHDIETRTEWKLLYAIYDPVAGTWSPPLDVTGTSSGNADFMPALATDGSGNALVLWVNDADGVFHHELDTVTDGTNVDYTNNDCDVYASKWTGSTWADPLRLTTDNPATELSPAVTFAPDDKALAVWVEKDGTTQRLKYSLFTPLENSWSSPLTITESPHLIEEPKVVVDSAGKATVVWRGHSANGSDLFSSWANMSDLVWSEPEQITKDDMVDWNISVALDSDKKVMTCWSKYDTVSGDEKSGSGFGDGVNMARTDPESAALTGTYSDQGIDTDSDGLFDWLRVSVEINVDIPGDYRVQAELYGTKRIAGVEASATGLAQGTHTFNLNFPGGIIFDVGEDGPYQLKNLVVLDMNDSAVATAFTAAPYTTGAYTADQFSNGPLSFDKTAYSGVLDKALITVTDRDENTDPDTQQTITVRVVSTMDPDGIAVALNETSGDTGIFTGEVGFNPDESNPAVGQIHVNDHCLVQVIYEDAAPSYRWIESATWLSLASAGDLNADGEIDLTDAIIALKVISGMDPGVSLSDYRSSESWIGNQHCVSIVEPVYILQRIAEIRE